VHVCVCEYEVIFAFGLGCFDDSLEQKGNYHVIIQTKQCFDATGKSKGGKGRFLFEHVVKLVESPGIRGEKRSHCNHVQNINFVPHRNRT